MTARGDQSTTVMMTRQGGPPPPGGGGVDDPRRATYGDFAIPVRHPNRNTKSEAGKNGNSGEAE